MVEAAIIAGMMVLVFACMWGAVSFQRAKLSAMNQARVAAWTAALRPCDGSENTLEDLANTTDDAESDPLPNTQKVDQFAALGKTSLAKDSGYVDVTRKQSAQFPKVIGGQTYELQAHMYMRCNEPDPPETALEFFKTGFAVLKSSFFP